MELQKFPFYFPTNSFPTQSTPNFIFIIIFPFNSQATPAQVTLYKLTKNDSNLEATTVEINFQITHQHFVRGKLKVNLGVFIHFFHNFYSLIFHKDFFFSYSI
jgi:hypothetical protein